MPSASRKCKFLLLAVFLFSCLLMLIDARLFALLQIRRSLRRGRARCSPIASAASARDRNRARARARSRLSSPRFGARAHYRRKCARSHARAPHALWPLRAHFDVSRRLNDLAAAATAIVESERTAVGVRSRASSAIPRERVDERTDGAAIARARARGLMPRRRVFRLVAAAHFFVPQRCGYTPPPPLVGVVDDANETRAAAAYRGCGVAASSTRSLASTGELRRRHRRRQK